MVSYGPTMQTSEAVFDQSIHQLNVFRIRLVKMTEVRLRYICSSAGLVDILSNPLDPSGSCVHMEALQLQWQHHHSFPFLTLSHLSQADLTERHQR